MNAWTFAERQLASSSAAERGATLRRWLRHAADDAPVAVRAPETASAHPSAYASAFARVAERSAALAAELRAERRHATEALGRLIDRPRGDRAAAVRERSELQTWSLARLLCQASLSAIHEDATEAVALAELAVAVAQATPGLESELRADLLTDCYAHLGNAHRAASRFAKADAAFQAAADHFTSSIRDPGRLGFLRAMQSVLMADRSRFDEALTLIVRAGAAFRRAGDSVSVGRAAIQEASMLYHLGRSREATRRLEHAAGVVESAGDPRLLFVLHANRAAYLVDLDEFAEARRSVARARALLGNVAGKFDRARLAWIEAELEAALDHHHEAEQRFRAVRETFLSAGRSHEVAIVTLELALLLARTGRFAEAKEAAREALPLLQSLGIGPETVLAVRLYAESSVASAAQVTLLSDVLATLRRWRRPPPG